MASVHLLHEFNQVRMSQAEIEASQIGLHRHLWTHRAYIRVQLYDERWTHAMGPNDELLLMHVIVVDRFVRIHVQL